MLHSFVISSALRRTPHSLVLHPLCRYKSITAAIEKGRGSGPDRFSRSSRPDRFSASSRSDRPFSPRSSPRYADDEVVSSKYAEREGGRARPSRSKSSLGARRRRWEDEDAAPTRRKELRKSGGWGQEESAVDRRIRDQDGERAESGRRDGPRREFQKNDRPRRDFQKDDRPRRDFQNDDRPRRDFQQDDRPRQGRDDDKPQRSRDDYQKDDRPRRRDDFQKDDRPRRRDDFQERSFERNDNHRRPNDRSARFDRMDRTERAAHTDHQAPSSIPSRDHNRDHNRERAPDSLPYTTAASDFIYGYSSVLAAIRAERRQFYKLYVNSRGLNRDVLLARAKAANLRQITREVGDQYDRAFDKASSGRPHNGFILEASPLPVPPITELAECTKDSPTFTVALGPQTKEELAVNGTRTAYPFPAPHRYPLILYLDGILDEGNLGAIARSAYFLGVDALITPTRQSAPWSHIALKASAGAAEALPIFKVTDSADFLGKASRNGWRCYAADAIPHTNNSPADAKPIDTGVVYTQSRSGKVLPDHAPVQQHPTILMLGAEGSGLKASLLNIAHYKVGIRRGARRDEVGVDSLNVSVAAGVLCQDILARKEKPVDPENVVF